VQVLDHQDQRGLLAQASEQAEEQFEQARLGGRAGRVRLRLAERGQHAGQLGPGRAGQLADPCHPDLAEQAPQRLHDRGVRQGAVADRQAATGQHPHPVVGAAARQLGDQARLSNTGFAPHEDDGRVAIRGPLPGRFEDAELLDTADQGGARRTTAHLAGIIARDRPEGNVGRSGRRPTIGWTAATLLAALALALAIVVASLASAPADPAPPPGPPMRFGTSAGHATPE
jgi:hypothetical protein